MPCRAVAHTPTMDTALQPMLVDSGTSSPRYQTMMLRSFRPPERDTKRSVGGIISQTLINTEKKPRGCIWYQSQDKYGYFLLQHTAAWWRQSGPSLVQVMACHLSGTKPLPELTLIYSYPKEQNFFGEIWNKIKMFSVTEIHFQMSSANVSHLFLLLRVESTNTLWSWI